MLGALKNSFSKQAILFAAKHFVEKGRNGHTVDEKMLRISNERVGKVYSMSRNSK